MEYEEAFTYRKESLKPEIDESGNNPEINAKLQLLKILDDIDNQVEYFRKGALYMEHEKDSLSTKIDGIKTSELINSLLESDKEDIIHYANRIASRCGSVEVSVHTERNELQEESLSQVNVHINNLISDLKDDPFIVKDRCISYMAACGSKEENYDKNFEVALLGCTSDDQTRIKRRLQGLLHYIDCRYETVNSTDEN